MTSESTSPGDNDAADERGPTPDTSVRSGGHPADDEIEYLAGTGRLGPIGLDR